MTSLVLFSIKFCHLPARLTPTGHPHRSPSPVTLAPPSLGWPGGGCGPPSLGGKVVIFLNNIHHFPTGYPHRSPPPAHPRGPGLTLAGRGSPSLAGARPRGLPLAAFGRSASRAPGFGGPFWLALWAGSLAFTGPDTPATTRGPGRQPPHQRKSPGRARPRARLCCVLATQGGRPCLSKTGLARPIFTQCI